MKRIIMTWVFVISAAFAAAQCNNPGPCPTPGACPPAGNSCLYPSNFQTSFVKMQGWKFMMNTTEFHQMGVNYAIYATKNNAWPPPGGETGPFTYLTRPAGTWCHAERCGDPSATAICAENQIREDLCDMVDMGLNSIRLVKLAEVHFDPVTQLMYAGYDWQQNYPLYDPYAVTQPQNCIDNLTNHLDAIDDALGIIDDYALKVILLTGARNSLINYQTQVAYENYLYIIADRFANDPAIMAYDIFNEPHYFDKQANHPKTVCPPDVPNPVPPDYIPHPILPGCWIDTQNWEIDNELDGFDYSKEDICLLVADWCNTIRLADPNHLITIGLSAGDLNEWDMGIVSVDFVNFHLYPARVFDNTTYNPQPVSYVFDRAYRDIKWISEVCPIPWTIGETGFSAMEETMAIPQCNQWKTCYNVTKTYPGDYLDDWGTTTDQANYAQGSLNLVRDCGGIGYTWWVFQDEPWNESYTERRENYYGLITSNDDRYDLADVPRIEKQVVNVFRNFDWCSPGACPSISTMPNYYFPYNQSYSNNFSGYVRDPSGSPIEHAYVGVETNTLGYVSTLTNAAGYFTLYSDKSSPFIIASFPGADWVKTTSYSTITLDYPKYKKDLYLSGAIPPIMPPVNSQAGKTLFSSNIISSDPDVTFKGGQGVNLDIGFTAYNGSYVHILTGNIIQDCYLYSDTPHNFRNPGQHNVPQSGDHDQAVQLFVIKPDFTPIYFSVISDLSDNRITIKNISDREFKITVYDLLGNVIVSDMGPSAVYSSYSLGEVSTSTYIVQIHDYDGKVHAFKIVKMY